MKMTEEIKIIEEESVIEENRTPAKVVEGSPAKKATDGKKKKKAGTSEKKKEEDKKGMKDKKEVDHDFPIRVNMIKFLAEERRQVIIDFAKAKLHASQQDLDHRIFAFIVNREENIS